MSVTLPKKGRRGIDGLFTLKANTRGALVVYDQNGDQLPGIQSIEVSQDLHHMNTGIAQVKLTMLVNVGPDEKIPSASELIEQFKR